MATEQLINSSENENITPSTIILEGDDVLKDAILKQIEFYFSAQNLPTDSFLLSKMDDDHYVTISLISTFGKIKSLTSDLNLITEALENSKIIELSPDKTKIRLKEQRRRNRLILHNLPDNTTDKDVSDVFSKGNFNPIVKSDVNNCWFVTFETEEEATSGLEFIRQQKIHDKVVRARLKPEPLLRNIYNAPDPNTTQFLSQNMLSYNYVYNPRGNWNPSMQPIFLDQNGENYNKNFDSKEGHRRNYKKQNRKDNRKGNKKRRKKRTERKHTPVQLGPSDFPPLPSASNTKNIGFSGEFKKYKHDEFINVLKNYKAEECNNLGEGFPIVSQPIINLESINPEPIESKDLPARTKPIPMSERVKKEYKTK